MFLFAREKRTTARKAKTASPACRKIPSGILPEGVDYSGSHIKSHAKAWFFIGEIIIFQLHPVFFVSLFPLIC